MNEQGKTKLEISIDQVRDQTKRLEEEQYVRFLNEVNGSLWQNLSHFEPDEHDRYAFELAKRIKRNNPDITEKQMYSVMYSCGECLMAERLEMYDEQNEKIRRLKRLSITDDQLDEALKGVKGNISIASKILGITRTQIYRRIKQVGKKPIDYRKS